MFRRQKSPVVSATHCNEMENLRVALEVMFGQSVRFRHIDFNTGHSAVRLGEEEKKISFFFGRSGLLDFSLWNQNDEPKEWYTALIVMTEEVWVIKDSNNQHKCGPWDMWWVGRSAIDRWEEPLYRKEAEHCAQVRGLSLKAFLRLEAGKIC